MTDSDYAYEVGYERGFAGRGPPQERWPTECPRKGPMADALKAGWADGHHDHVNKLPKGTSFDLP